MTKRADIKGQRFGKLVAQRYVGYIKTHAMWECLCDCGNIKITSVSALKDRRTTSCGCILVKNISGKIIGNWEVLNKYDKNGWNGRIRWLCRCSCGYTAFIHSCNLKSGKTKSCRKCSTKRIGKLKLKNLQGKVFGELTVIERGKDYITPKGDKQVTWICKCSCGKLTNRKSRELKSSTSCGCRTLKQSWIAEKVKLHFVNKYDGIEEYKIFKNPLTGRFLPFDLYIPKNKTFVEINGTQHYAFKEGLHKNKDEFKYSKYKDKIKRNFACKNGNYVEIDLRKIKTYQDAIAYIEKRL